MRSSAIRSGLAQRARIVLLAADGMSNTAIAEQVGCLTDGDLVAAARSITFFSSRTLPSHALQQHRSAGGVRPLIGLRIRCAHSRMNAAVRYGMSSRRSRSGGSVTSTMFRR